MSDLLLRLQKLNKKVVSLEKRLSSLQEELHDLEQQLEASQEELRSKQMDYELMVERYEALRLSKSLTNPEDRTAIQEKIDWYLKEIDICLNNFGD